MTIDTPLALIDLSPEMAAFATISAASSLFFCFLFSLTVAYRLGVAVGRR